MSPLAVIVGDLPEHVGPLGIARQEDHAGLAGGNRGSTQLSLDRLEITTALFLTLRHLADEGFLALTAVKRNAQVACDLPKLAQSQTCQRGEGLGHVQKLQFSFGIIVRPNTSIQTLPGVGVSIH